MIEKKEFFLWVLENGEPVRKPLLEIDLTGQRKHSLEEHLYEEIPSWHFLNFDQNLFAGAYIETITNIMKEFEEVIRLGYSHNLDLNIAVNNVYEWIKYANIAFADTSAFEQKAARIKRDEEDEDYVPKPIGYFCRNEGIVLNLKSHSSIKKTCRSLIHEYGHYLDYLLNPENHDRRTATMLEVMAFLIGDNFYRLPKPSGRPHQRAYHLLRSLEQTNFKYMSFAEKWLILNPLLDHKDAQDYFKKHLERLPPILPARF